MMIRSRHALIGLLWLGLAGASGQAAAQLACGPFTGAALDPPAPRIDKDAIASFQRINEQVKTQPYRALFFGDSITERWMLPLWGAGQTWWANFPWRGVLNAGVSGDRTEHLLWRFDHGNLAGPPPKLAIVLIGTNDIGHGRTPEVVAEGVRAVLLRLRQRVPDTRILLLGLWPRGPVAGDPYRRGVAAVNRLIEHCGDGATVTYADIGGVLLDPGGALSKTVSPDMLHFSGVGYARLVPKLTALLDQLIGMPQQR